MSTTAPQTSAAQEIVSEVVDAFGDDAPTVLETMLSELTITELVALWYDWEGFWARPKQLLPDGNWRSFGLLTGRGFGKTRTNSEFVQREVVAGRARRIALIAQNETKTIEVMVDGESGLLATSPPWFRARFEKGRVIWPNGAQAFVYTPEVPGALRGPEHDLAWMSEPVVWPAATREEAFSNLRLGLRLGYGRMVWDSTPKRRHPLIRYLLRRAEKHPQHVVVRGSTYENVSNLTADAVAEWEDEYGGTQKGREELEGEFLDDSDGALWKQEWIDRARRDLPAELTRRILSIDPAISEKKGRDQTGIIDEGLGVDGQIYVLADLTAKHAWEAWGVLVVVRYFEARCDCVVVERNRGGDAVTANLRAVAKDPEVLARLGLEEIRVEVLQKGAPTRHVSGVLYVKEETASVSKTGRHEPVATLYEKGRVSHVKTADLGNLEDTLTTWEPVAGKKSPDGIDALVQGAWELAQLANRSVDLSQGFAGLTKVSEQLRSASGGRCGGLGIGSLLGGRSEPRL